MTMNVFKGQSCTNKLAMYLTFIIVFNFHNNHGKDSPIFDHFTNENTEAQRVEIICPGDTAVTGNAGSEI